ncbi:DUF1819 family protein [Belliella sp. DSM 111904]|uniref:DUF1819 family protein n=1 Tax=Belliella filtrata TaxID=2923435 RepID=A0ABS9V1C0_9BACT|nr:DUF1819 family protein [Belliella filtrata]MCH7410181.1 DUF1819 family protein [Belliella filtrata]
MENPSIYKFSFTALSLKVRETISLAQKLKDENLTLEDLSPKDLPDQRGATSKRKFQELIRRLNQLSKEELNLLAEGNPSEQKQLCLLGFARYYRFFYEFVTESMVDKIMLFDYELTDRDINSFISRKSIDHPELESLAETTRKKVVQVLWKVLEQSELINSVTDRKITPPFLEKRLENLIVKNNPNDLKVFMYTEDKIKSNDRN